MRVPHDPPEPLPPAPPLVPVGVGWTAAELEAGGAYRRAIERGLARGPRYAVAAFLRVYRRCVASAKPTGDPLWLLSLLVQHGTGQVPTMASRVLFLVGQAAIAADRDAVAELIAAFLGRARGALGDAPPAFAARADHLRFLLRRGAPRAARVYAERAFEEYVEANERVPDDVAAALEAGGPAGDRTAGAASAAGAAPLAPDASLAAAVPIATYSLVEVLDLLVDADLGEGEHKTKDLTIGALRQRVVRARDRRRAGGEITRRLDRMLVDAMQGRLWRFDAVMVRDWISAERGAVADEARIREEILTLSADRHRVE